jgi:polyketide biosynthesis enoyl-CoA hydratase PksH
MELTSAIVRVPIDLRVDSVAALARDLEIALASPSPVVTLVGATADTFCLGMALGVDGDHSAHAFADVLATMHAAAKPLIAVVDGSAIGGGMGIACACDWLIATERSSFGLPELLWGLVPAIIWPVVTDRMPPHLARRWVLSAHSRSGADAFAAGVVDELAPEGTLDAALRRSTLRLRRLDGDALRRMRAWARASRQHELPVALRLGADLTAALVQQTSARRRWQAFADGEAPWSA